MNNFKAYFLLTVLTFFMLVIGDLIAGHPGILVAAILAVLMNVNAYFYADVIILRLYHAKKVEDTADFPARNSVKSLADKAGLPMPALYVIDSDIPNAFAVGRNPKKASLAVTTGLLSILNHNELTAVLAYEMAHILHQDIFLDSAIATVVGGITGIADKAVWAKVFGMHVKNKKPHLNGVIMMIVGPIAALLVRLAMIRSKEFEADAAGAALCGNPLWLVSALEKIEVAKSKDIFIFAETHPGTAHLFVVNPLHEKKLAALFATHPLTEKRIRRLKESPANAVA